MADADARPALSDFVDESIAFDDAAPHGLFTAENIAANRCKFCDEGLRFARAISAEIQ